MPVDNIIQILERSGGYRRAPQPLQISEVEFKGMFDAVLVGPMDQNGLVLVLGAESPHIEQIKYAVKAFATALDRAGSMRPFTLVLATTVDVDDRALVALQDYCRVIAVPSSGKAEDYLRVLLPLRLPSPEARKKSADSALREELKDSKEDPLIDALITAARKSSDEVQRKMREEINRVAVRDLRGGRGS